MCGASDHRVAEPQAFIREKEEKLLVYDWTTEAACVIAVFLVIPRRAVLRDDGERATLAFDRC